MSNNAHDLSNRLLNALDNNYNVVDMHAVNEIISILEKFNITKELLETTRLGKHVNELRRKTTDPTLARRAKVLVKRWRDLVIPTRASPAHTGSNRSSAERQVRRLGGTPLTSPALSRVVSPAVPSPRPPSRPAWGGYESDSQDVILVDDDPPAPPAPVAALASAPHKPVTPPVKRPSSPVSVHDDKKAKRDKKPKKRRGHSRAGSGTEATGGAGAGAALALAGALAPAAWGARNGAAHAHLQPPAPAPAPSPAASPAQAQAQPDRRRNGCRRNAIDPYAALVNKMPPAGAKKVKTTKELLEEIQSRGSVPLASPGSPDDDVVLVDDVYPVVNVDSPLRNGGGESRAASPPARSPRSPAARPLSPLEEERPAVQCTCSCDEDDAEQAALQAARCPAAARAGSARAVRPHRVRALHHALVGGLNGTRAPLLPHRFAVRPAVDPARPGLFASVVPLYKYSDYADDYCVKNLSRVPLAARPPPDREPSPEDRLAAEVDREPAPEPEPSLPERPAPLDRPPDEFESEHTDHRTVERTKAAVDGRTLFELCSRAARAVPFRYEQAAPAPLVALRASDEEPEPEAAERLEAALAAAAQAAEAERDALGRPPRPPRFAEWHECAQLGDLVALPYVVID